MQAFLSLARCVRHFALTLAVITTAISGANRACAQDTNTIVIGKPFIAAGLDPTKVNNGWALTSHGIGQNLFMINAEGVVTPWLATSVERESVRAWLVHVRPGVNFSDGSPMDAAAVASALARNNELNGAARAVTGRIVAIPIDPLTLHLETERAVPNMASVLADWPEVIYRVVGDDFVFTGPYKVAAASPGDEFRLVPNPHYPGATKRPAVRIKYFADTQSMALALQSGELDMAFGLPAEAVPRIAAQPGLFTRSLIDGYIYLLLMNEARPPLDDVRVRRAIDLALDRELLVKAAKGGKPAQALYSAHYPYALKDSYPHDPQQAVKLLDEAGWQPGGDGMRGRNGHCLSLTVVAVSTWTDLAAYVPVMRTEFGKLGIKLVPRVVESFLPAANSGEFNLLFRLTHTGRAGDPALFLNDSLRSNAVRNFGKHRGAALDAVLARLEGEADPGQRSALIVEAQRLVRDDAPIVPISEAAFHVGLSARLKDYPLWGADYYIIRDDSCSTLPAQSRPGPQAWHGLRQTPAHLLLQA
jgi:peptide/nickel transport system substrate-binding protein